MIHKARNEGGKPERTSFHFSVDLGESSPDDVDKLRKHLKELSRMMEPKKATFELTLDESLDRVSCEGN